MRWFALLVLIIAVVPRVGAVTGLEGERLTRYHDLNAELRCLICQNRSIAESDAPLAKDLRAVVARQIADGRTDTQIKQYLVDRYGEWVLYDPPFGVNTLILWVGPFVLLALGLLIVVLLMRRRRDMTPAAPTLDRERLARLLDDHDNDSSRERS